MTIGLQVDCWTVFPTRARVPAAAPGAASTVSFPTANIVMPPGIIELMSGYKFDTRSSAEGLLAWFGVNSATKWCSGGRLILAKTAQNGGDFYAALKAISMVFGYGMGSDNLAPAQAIPSARFGTAFALCGNTTNRYMFILRSLGYTCREVACCDKVYTGWDDGHAAFEVYYGGRWRFVDAVWGVYYQDGQGNHLSWYEVMEARPGGCTAVYLRTGAPDSVPTFMTEWSNGFVPNVGALWPCRAYVDCYLQTKDDYLNWCERVYGIPFLQGTDGTYYGYMTDGGDSQRGRLAAGGFQLLDKEVWRGAFYPNNKTNA